MKINTGMHKKKFTGLWIGVFYCLFSACVNAEAITNETTAVEVAPVVNSEIMPAPIIAPVSAHKSTLPANKKINSSSQLASLLGGLLLILALIYGLSWFVKRFTQGGFMQNSTIRMLAAMPLGTRERILLVDVGGKQILLGVTATQINALHVFEEPVIVSAEKITTNNVNSVPSDFSQKLMSLLQQKNIKS